MRAYQFIKEAPLPLEWDKTQFRKPLRYDDYDSMVNYARSKAKYIDRGSSRIALEIPYNGRKTVLKVALNRAGIAQNKAEASILSVPWVKNSGKVIPMIDYDKANYRYPRWIHVEHADNANNIASYMRMGLRDLVDAATSEKYKNEVLELYEKDPFFDKAESVDMINFLERLEKGLHVDLDDFRSTRNWGIYNGKAVILDLGFNAEIQRKYY